MSKIIYTHTDEAPMLATYSFLPIIEAFASTAGVEVETRDISLAGRIIAVFGDYLTPEQQIGDALAELGELAKTPEANIIKLPNISASIPQLKAAIAELQEQGYALPDYPDNPSSDEETAIRSRYDKIKGSAVNPVLREGNSDRRAPLSVKNYARQNPHSMGAWTADSKTNVATMGQDDFRSNEKSVVVESEGTIAIQLVREDGSVKVLKKAFPVLAGEVIDGTVMRAAALDEFLKAQVARAKEEGVLFSAHLKATMMKVSDPIIFGHVVKAYFSELFETYGKQLSAAGISPNNGLAAILSSLEDLPEDVREGVQNLIKKGLEDGPSLAMVDSDKGITTLNVPSDVIVDASMPAMIRSSGHMWGPDGKEADTLAVLPDSSYAGIYQVVIDDCRANGAYDPTTMGTVPNVGLMAQAAEEYGSHDKTFEIQEAGTVQIVDGSGNVLVEHQVSEGDIWRACQTKDLPIRDWVKLAVTRARASKTPAVFWLDEERAHDANLIAKVNEYLKEHDTEGLDIQIMSPGQGDRFHPGPHPQGGGHHLGVRQRAPRLPHGPVPHPRAGHQRQDALRCSADERRRPVRNRRRRVCPQARPAAAQGKPPALGQPGRVPGPGRQLRAPGHHNQQRPRAGPGRHPGPRHRDVPAGEQVAQPPCRRAGQPRQPLLPGPLLG
ncbi:hypothetical protein GCM10018951_29250 [Pseudarthrobacter polychromogenes]